MFRTFVETKKIKNNSLLPILEIFTNTNTYDFGKIIHSKKKPLCFGGVFYLVPLNKENRRRLGDC